MLAHEMDINQIPAFQCYFLNYLEIVVWKLKRMLKEHLLLFQSIQVPCAPVPSAYTRQLTTLILAPGNPIPSLGLQDSNTHTNTHIIKKKKKVVILECCPKLKRL